MDDTKDPSKKSDSIAQEISSLFTTKDFLTDESSKVAPRYSSVEGKDVLFLLLKETDDSFVAMMPMEIMYMNESPVLRDITPGNIGRIMKSSVSILSRPSHKDLVWYLFSVAQKFDSEPEFFTEQRRSNVLALISILAEQQGLPDLTKHKVTEGKSGSVMYEISSDGQEKQLDDLTKTDLGTFTSLLRSTRKH